MRQLVFLVLIFSLGACSTVTIRDKGSSKLAGDPTYSDSKSYFFWGLVGEKHVDVVQVCGTQQAKQMQAQTTFLDGFLTAITLGIYSPRTAKVWCK